jgi:hypothetical protein
MNEFILKYIYILLTIHIYIINTRFNMLSLLNIIDSFQLSLALRKL